MNRLERIQRSLTKKTAPNKIGFINIPIVKAVTLVLKFVSNIASSEQRSYYPP